MDVQSTDFTVSPPLHGSRTRLDREGAGCAEQLASHANADTVFGEVGVSGGSGLGCVGSALMHDNTSDAV